VVKYLLPLAACAGLFCPASSGTGLIPPPSVAFELKIPGGGPAKLSIAPPRDRALASFVAAPAATLLQREAQAGENLLVLPASGSWQLEAAASGYFGAEAVLAGVAAPLSLPGLELVRRASPGATLLVAAGSQNLKDALVLARPARLAYPDPWRPATLRLRGDAAGRFPFPAGVFCEVLVAAPGRPIWRGAFELAPGAQRQIELETGRPLELTVVDRDGRPVPAAQVAVDGLLLEEKTSATGRLAIVAAAAGIPAIRILAADGGWASRAAETRPAGQLAPLRLELASPQKLAVRVFDGQDLRPLGGALLWPGGHPEIAARSSSQGEAELVVPWGGATTLAAAAAAYQPLVAEIAQAQRLLLRPAAPPGVAARGRVEDPRARPVAGALVRWRPAADQLRLPSEKQSGAEATTDASGTFVFAGVAVREVDLEVAAKGWAPARVRGIAISPAAGKAESELGTIVLEPGAAIAGRVLDGRGEPLAGALVRAREPAGGELRELATAADGGFRFDDFAAGTIVELSAEHRDAQSSALLVEAGLEAETLIVLAGASRVAGRVLAGGEGLAGALVLLRSGDQTRASTRSDDRGRFELNGVKPGMLAVEAVAPGLIGEAFRFELAAGESAEDLALELAPGGVVEGRVRSATGEPLEGVRIELVGGQRDLAHRLASPGASSDADGAYRLTGLPAGQRLLRARRADLLPAERQLEVVAGSQELDWQLAGGLRLEGRIVDSQSRPVAAARIVVFDLAGRAVGEPGQSDAGGSFLLEGLPAGELRVVGEAEQQAKAERKVALSAGGRTEEVLLVCPAPASLEGRLLGASFEALSRAKVWATGPTGEQRQGQVAYDGSYQIRGLGPGEWRVAARAPGFPREAGGRVALREGEPASLDLELPQGGYRLAGVVSRGGAPLAGLLVSAASESGAVGGAVTDANGVFAIDALPAGAYRITLLGAGASALRQVDLQRDLELRLELDGEGQEGTAAPGKKSGAITPQVEEIR
jgi:hypothetical protein